MKQIITLLLVVLVSIPVNGQILNQKNQESENLKTTKLFSSRSTHKNGPKDIKDRDFIVKRKAEMLKSSSIDAPKYLDSLTIQEWDNDYNIWRYSNKQEFTYENDRVKTATLYIWDGSELVPSSKTDYTFDDNGNLISETWSIIGLTLGWSPLQKTDYTYFLNKDGIYKLMLEENFANYTLIPQWVNTYKYELTYDTYETSVILEIGSEWINGAWTNMNMVDYLYDGRLSSKIFSNWISVNNAWTWVNNSKWEYFYDGMPKVEEIVYRWEAGTTDDWIEEYKYEYEWEHFGDPLMVLTTETEYIWDTDDWENYYLNEYQYDSNGNGISGLYYYWNGDWALDEKDEFYFDLAYNFDDLIAPFFSADEELYDTMIQFNNMVIGYRYYIYTNQNWVDNMKILFFYSDYTNQLDIEDIELANAIDIYPNPAGDILFIKSEIPLTKVEFYSVLGEKVKEINNDFKVIPLNDISDGIYIVKIQSENRSVSKKIIKYNMSL